MFIFHAPPGINPVLFLLGSPLLGLPAQSLAQSQHHHGAGFGNGRAGVRRYFTKSPSQGQESDWVREVLQAVT